MLLFEVCTIISGGKLTITVVGVAMLAVARRRVGVNSAAKVGKRKSKSVRKPTPRAGGPVLPVFTIKDIGRQGYHTRCISRLNGDGSRGRRVMATPWLSPMFILPGVGRELTEASQWARARHQFGEPTRIFSRTCHRLSSHLVILGTGSSH